MVSVFKGNDKQLLPPPHPSFSSSPHPRHDPSSPIVYIHIPKTGGTFLSQVLQRSYQFRFYLLRRPDHESFTDSKERQRKHGDLIKNHLRTTTREDARRFLEVNQSTHPLNHKHGLWRYYATSPLLQKRMNMSTDDWNRSSIFCFVRNPYTRLMSSYIFMKEQLGYPGSFRDFLFSSPMEWTDYEYAHIYLPQYQHIVDEHDHSRAHLIGHFESFYPDFIKILRHYGFHTNRFQNRPTNVSKRSLSLLSKEIDQDCLDRMNNILHERDFVLGGYSRVSVLRVYRTRHYTDQSLLFLVYFFSGIVLFCFLSFVLVMTTQKRNKEY